MRLKLVSADTANRVRFFKIIERFPALADVKVLGFAEVIESSDKRMAEYLVSKFEHVEKGEYHKVRPSVLEDIYMLACVFYYQKDEPILSDDQHDSLGTYMAKLDHEFVYVTKEDLRATTRPRRIPFVIQRIANLMGVE